MTGSRRTKKSVGLFAANHNSTGGVEGKREGFVMEIKAVLYFGAQRDS